MSKFDCYVYECSDCGKKIFINKEQNQMNLFTCRCNCSYPKNKYLFLGEGSYLTEEINTPKYKEKSDTYIRKNICKSYKNNDVSYEVMLED